MEKTDVLIIGGGAADLTETQAIQERFNIVAGPFEGNDGTL